MIKSFLNIFTISLCSDDCFNILLRTQCYKDKQALPSILCLLPVVFSHTTSFQHVSSSYSCFYLSNVDCFSKVFKPEELRQALMPTLEALYRQDPESLPFRQPVDPQLLGIPVSVLARYFPDFNSELFSEHLLQTN